MWAPFDCLFDIYERIVQSAAPSCPCTLCLRRLVFVGGISASHAAALLTA